MATSLSYTPDAPLANGAHMLYVRESDEAGNESASGWFTVTVDSAPSPEQPAPAPVPPAAAPAAPADVAASDGAFAGRVRVSWAAADGATGYQVLSDYAGDGASDLAVYDVNTGHWFIRSLSKNDPIAWQLPWGWPGALPPGARP